jgi:hypothetical protein
MSSKTDNPMGGVIYLSFILVLIYIFTTALGWAWDKETRFEESRLRPYIEGTKALLEEDARKDREDTDLTDNYCY